jgi:hypothetical protein
VAKIRLRLSAAVPSSNTVASSFLASRCNISEQNGKKKKDKGKKEPPTSRPTPENPQPATRSAGRPERRDGRESNKRPSATLQIQVGMQVLGGQLVTWSKLKLSNSTVML